MSEQAKDWMALAFALVLLIIGLWAWGRIGQVAITGSVWPMLRGLAEYLSAP
jgi:hypothetical protein